MKAAEVDLTATETITLGQRVHRCDRPSQNHRLSGIGVEVCEAFPCVLDGQEVRRRGFGKAQPVEILLPIASGQLVVDDT